LGWRLYELIDIYFSNWQEFEVNPLAARLTKYAFIFFCAGVILAYPLVLLIMCVSTAGGDSKTLMFVQISPNENDVGETLCSLNFASRVRGIELGQARKQVDVGELSRYKLMVLYCTVDLCFSTI
jgi:hypothetical protein